MPIRHRFDSRKTLFALAAATAVGLGGGGALLLTRGHPVTAAAAGYHRQVIAATPAPTFSYRLPDNAAPNEMGRIPVLMYHSVGDPPLTGRLARFSHLGLSIPASLLRKHLEMLYASGFYPVNLRDILSPTIDIPLGRTPVVLTFDDARASQFRYHRDGSIDPNCAIGVLAAFHKLHPDWPERATFFILPESRYNPAPFGQHGREKQKFEYLFDHGYELANHSTTHHPMARMDAKMLVWEMATCARFIHHLVPDAPVDTMALPYGIRPAKALLPVLLGNGSNGYKNRCIALAAGDASYAPGDKRFNKLGVMRIGSEPGNIERWIKVLKAARVAVTRNGIRAYVSDGDPVLLSAPKSLTKYINRTSLGTMKLALYADPTKPLPKHSISAKSSRVARKG